MTNILFNLASRICTIVSNYKTWNKRLKELKELQLKREFSSLLVDNRIEHVKAIDLEDIQKLQKTKKILRYVQPPKYRSIHYPQEDPTIETRPKNERST